MRVCLLKVQPRKRDLEGNFARLEAVLERTVGSGATLGAFCIDPLTGGYVSRLSDF